MRRNLRDLVPRAGACLFLLGPVKSGNVVTRRRSGEIARIANGINGDEPGKTESRAASRETGDGNETSAITLVPDADARERVVAERSRPERRPYSSVLRKFRKLSNSFSHTATQSAHDRTLPASQRA